MAAACTSLDSESGKQVITKEGVPGAYSVETYKTVASVTALDAAARTVTIVSRDGRKRELRAGPDVANFEQIRVGDRVSITVAEELLVYLAGDEMPVPEGSTAAAALAPREGAPGALRVGTTQVTAKLVGLDREFRKATLQMPDGRTQTFTVRRDIDLSKRAVGEAVIFRSTEAMAIRVEKP
jgi:hypothetical protein